MNTKGNTVGQVVIFGANGFLGRYLTRHFLQRGREVVAVARESQDLDPAAMDLEWDGTTIGPWTLALEGASLVINLAGRSVDCRYDAANKNAIMESRVETTRLIGEAIASCETPPAVWMNASTATWYRHAEDGPQDEWHGEPGEGFSCEVATAWERAFFECPTPGATRKLALRLGMVLANEPGSVFDRFARFAQLGLGGTLGSGRQRVSWMHMEDMIAAIEWLEQDPLSDGVFNLTAPEAPTNRAWMRAFREVMAMPLGLISPEWAVRLGARCFGTEEELVLKSRWVRPRRLEEAGFVWRYPRVGPALVDLVGRPGLDAFFAVPAVRAVGARAWTATGSLRTA
jgi:uncharacterized protein (TIGR01777 family)